MNFFFIGFGAFIGACFRYVLSISFNTIHLPYGTFIANAFGCFIIGLSFSFIETLNYSKELKLFFITGLLGSMTTFSTFSYESLNYLINGKYFLFTSYTLLTLVMCLSFTLLGIVISKLYFNF
jgi:CrcB protein